MYCAAVGGVASAKREATVKMPREVEEIAKSVCLQPFAGRERSAGGLTGSGDINCVISDIAPKFWSGFPCNRGHSEPSPFFLGGRRNTYLGTRYRSGRN